MVVRAKSRSQSGEGGHERHSLLRQCVATMKCNSMNRVICMLSRRVAGNSQGPAADKRDLAPCSGWQALEQLP